MKASVGCEEERGNNEVSLPLLASSADPRKLLVRTNPPPPPSGGPSPSCVRRPDIKYYWEVFSGARKRPASLKRGGKDYPPY